MPLERSKAVDLYLGTRILGQREHSYDALVVLHNVIELVSTDRKWQPRRGLMDSSTVQLKMIAGLP